MEVAGFHTTMLPYFTFGNVTESTSLVISKCEYQMLEAAMRLACRPRSPNHPFGDAGLIGAANNVDLAEGTISYAGQNVTA
jgi:hypothetical protein